MSDLNTSEVNFVSIANFYNLIRAEKCSVQHRRCASMKFNKQLIWTERKMWLLAASACFLSKELHSTQIFNVKAFSPIIVNPDDFVHNFYDTISSVKLTAAHRTLTMVATNNFSFFLQSCEHLDTSLLRYSRGYDLVKSSTMNTKTATWRLK